MRPAVGAATPTSSSGPVMAQVKVFWVVWRSWAISTSATLKMVKVMFTLSSPSRTLTSTIQR